MPINYKDYPVNWKDEIRPTVLKRDGFKCQHCGVRNYQHYILHKSGRVEYIEDEDIEFSREKGFMVKRSVLTVAHMDNDISNNNYDNLITLCAACHNRFDVDYRKINRMATKVLKIVNKAVKKKAIRKIKPVIGLVGVMIEVSCSASCSPSDWCKGGKCDLNGCYKEL
jgi:5-methylcytosine-specific restriction endonuclease McrA